MKAILVVDINMTQDNKHICEDDNQHCSLWNTDTKFCMYNFNNNTKGCPLKPMPKKLPIESGSIMNTFKESTKYRHIGFNQCVDEILGEKE